MDFTCSDCRQSKPATEFAKNSTAKSGLSCRCKLCMAAYRRRRYREPDVKASHLAATTTWRQQHPEQSAAHTAKWRRNNLEKCRELARKNGRARWKRPGVVAARKAKLDANREAFRKYWREWYANNIERLKAHTDEEKAIVNAKNKRWRSRNPDKCAAMTAMQRAKRSKALGSHTGAEWEAVKQKFGNVCLCCGRGDRKLTADHVIPLCKGGTNFIENLQPLCISCNCSKNAKIIDYRPSAQVAA